MSDYIALLESESFIDQAVEMFGLTRNPKECGYILRDGRMLDFSGRHWDGSYRKDERHVWYPKRGHDYAANHRLVDHRDLGDLSQGGTEGMVDFMKATGAIRSMPDSGFTLVTAPSRKQISAMISSARTFSDFYIEVWDDHYDVVASADFSARASVSEIVEFFVKTFGPSSITESHLPAWVR